MSKTKGVTVAPHHILDNRNEVTKEVLDRLE
jgi:hypothetical protein